MIGYLRGKMTLGFLFFVTETFYKIRTTHDAYSSRAFGMKNIDYLLLQPFGEDYSIQSVVECSCQ